MASDGTSFVVRDSRESRMSRCIEGGERWLVGVGGGCFGEMALAGCVDWIAASGLGGVASDGASFAVHLR